uniref:Dual specificity protein phosphatase n=1 Tax=Syphacia muris TaxID=451379 RepID=A0A0N5AZA7_9BILA
MTDEVITPCSSKYISDEELISKLQDSAVVVLDCRQLGPGIKGANRVRLPKVLLHRLNAGTLPPASLCPDLSVQRKVLVISDTADPGSLADSVMKLLVDKAYDVQLSLIQADKLLAHNFELKDDLGGKDGFSVVGTLSLENLQLRENGSVVDLAEKRRAADIFPVEILPYLYLGNADTAADREILDRYNIRYIINVTRDLENSFESDSRFHYLKIAVDDSSSNNLAQYFPTAIEFIEEALRTGSTVLVHCLAGISRSVTVCLAYLMHYNGSTLDEAFDLVHKRNALIAPNFHFMGQLSEFEQQLASTNNIRKDDRKLSSNILPSTSKDG